MPVLFDFDGTLADTVPELTTALNIVLARYHVPATSIASLRPLVSAGSSSFLAALLPSTLQAEVAVIRQEFLQVYAEFVLQTKSFAGMDALIASLGQHDLAWGVVSNRMTALLQPVLAAFAWQPAPQCIIGVDLVKQPKPSPEGLLLACQQLQCRPAQCLYIGDAESDILAGRAAGMHTAVAMFGYIPNVAQALAWPADFFIHNVADMMEVILRWQSQIPQI
jgi:2-phosphoglycolate phosphatase